MTQATVTWHRYKLRTSVVNTALVVGKRCRVQTLDAGFWSVEVEGLEPQLCEEPEAICLRMAELSAEQGKRVRRFVDANGEEVYRAT